MTFGQFISILRARWLIFLLVFALSLGTALGIRSLMGKEYRASAAAIIDFRPDPVSAALYGGLPPPALLATQLDIIRSARVSSRVVRNLKLNEQPSLKEQWQTETNGIVNFDIWVGEFLRRNLEVLPSRESSVITVQYKSPDPKFAAALANAFVQAYIDVAIELRVDPAKKYASFFDGQSKGYRDALERAQVKLSEFQKRNGIIASEERLDVENLRLNELSSQLTALQAISAESNSRQAQAQGGQGDRMQEVLSSPLISSLKAELSRAEAKLQELTTRLGDNHPQVQEAKASAQELRSRLDSETRRVTSGVTVSNTINRQREAEVRAALNAQRANVLRMKAVRDEGVVLLRELESAQRTHDSVVQRANQTSLESQATQSNVNLLTQAEIPLKPSSPNTPLILVLGVVSGVILGLGVALGIEMRDRRVRSVDDVVLALDLPVIGTMPRPGAKFKLVNRPSLMQQRLLAALPHPAKTR